MYWRIIRTNEDGSVRILYSGTSPDTTSGYIGTSAFNNDSDDPMYVGYMYGTTGSLANNRKNTNSSTIKTVIDTWYQNNLLTNYDKYISKSAIYCNDRSYDTTEYTYSTSSSFYYGAGSRLFTNTNKAPSYKCGADATDGLFESTQATADKFSVSASSGGNGLLKYPIALMTADEATFAGAAPGTFSATPKYIWYYINNKKESILGDGYFYLLSSFDYLTPATDSNKVSAWITCYSSGNIYGYSGGGVGVQDIEPVRPVISLDTCVGIKSGNGTPTNPYVVDENSCS